MNYISIVMGLFLILLGIFLYKGTLVDIVAGFDEEVEDREKTGKWVGSNLIIIGMIISIISILNIIFPEVHIVYILIIQMVVLVSFSLRTIILFKKKTYK